MGRSQKGSNRRRAFLTEMEKGRSLVGNNKVKQLHCQLRVEDMIAERCAYACTRICYRHPKSNLLDHVACAKYRLREYRELREEDAGA